MTIVNFKDYSDKELKKMLNSNIKYFLSNKISKEEEEFHNRGIDDNLCPIHQCEYFINSITNELAQRMCKNR